MYLNFTCGELYQVQQQCIKQQHLSDKTNITDLIDTDLNYINSKDITIDQICDILEKVNLHTEYSKKYIDHNIDIELFLKKVRCNNQWNINSITYTKIFNDTLTVFKVSYNGSEKCPFDNICNCSKIQYETHTLGDSEYVLLNNINKRELIFSSLLIHQIRSHYFFQDSSSEYRLEPYNIIDFFNIKPDVSYKTIYETVPVFDTFVWINKKRIRQIISESKIIEDTETYTLYYNDNNIWFFFSKIDFHPYHYRFEDFIRYSIPLTLGNYSIQYHPGCSTEECISEITIKNINYVLDLKEYCFSLN